MKNVLLVDDDHVFNLLNRKTIERMGIANEIHTALNGEEAIDLLNNYFQGSQSLPDIILLDLRMPIMDGFGFIEAFRKLNLPNKENVRIIIITSSIDSNDVDHAKRLGITHYLTKPVSEKQLRMALDSVPNYMMTM